MIHPIVTGIGDEQLLEAFRRDHEFCTCSECSVPPGYWEGLRRAFEAAPTLPEPEGDDTEPLL